MRKRKIVKAGAAKPRVKKIKPNPNLPYLGWQVILKHWFKIVEKRPGGKTVHAVITERQAVNCLKKGFKHSGGKEIDALKAKFLKKTD